MDIVTRLLAEAGELGWPAAALTGVIVLRDALRMIVRTVDLAIVIRGTTAGDRAAVIAAYETARRLEDVVGCERRA